MSKLYFRAFLSLALTSLSAYASHDEPIGARFVQPGGVDVGNCLDHDTPCVSIPYALAQAEPGNTVKVGGSLRARAHHRHYT